MSVEENKAIVRKYFEEMDRLGPDKVREFFTPDATVHFPGFPPMDLEATMQGAQVFATAFPDLTHKIEDLIAEGDRVVVRATDKGTHKGEFQGIPPTGKEITLTVIAIFGIVEGKIAEIWEELDMLGMLDQLGVIPPLGEGGG